MAENNEELRKRLQTAMNEVLENWIKEKGEAPDSDPFTIQDKSTPDDAEAGRANFLVTVNDPVLVAQIYANRMNEALRLSVDGQIDGAHHKTWVVDQMVRALLGTPEAYEAWVKEYYQQAGDWDEGIPP